MKRRIMSFLADDGGATAIEYGLVAALVSVAGLVAYDALGTAVDNIYNYLSSSVDAAANPP